MTDGFDYEFIKRVQRYYRFRALYLEKEVDFIIREKIVSEKQIEKVLDNLLDCLYTGSGEEQFIRLNSYYGSFSRENSREYYRYYREIVSE